MGKANDYKNTSKVPIFFLQPTHQFFNGTAARPKRNLLKPSSFKSLDFETSTASCDINWLSLPSLSQLWPCHLAVHFSSSVSNNQQLNGKQVLKPAVTRLHLPRELKMQHLASIIILRTTPRASVLKMHRLAIMDPSRTTPRASVLKTHRLAIMDPSRTTPRASVLKMCRLAIMDPSRTPTSVLKMHPLVIMDPSRTPTSVLKMHPLAIMDPSRTPRASVLKIHHLCEIDDNR
jgi:hypothetical protein